MQKNKPIGLGIVGLGRAFTLMLPTFQQDERVRLVAATDPRVQACRQFEQDFSAPTYDSVKALCADPEVEAVYVASPHQMHADHVELAARAGKAVLVEKPLAITLDDCSRIVGIANETQVPVIVGHSHSFDAPVLHAAALIASGRFGAVRMLNAMNYTDYMYRPRRPEELDTTRGGGVVFSQAAHQVDIVRLLMGGCVKSVRAHTGNWDPDRATEGAYMALLSFESGAFASLTYSGYAHYDSDELMGDIDEMGYAKSASAYGQARARLNAIDPAKEAELKAARTYGGEQYRQQDTASTQHHQHFGNVLVSTDRADIRLTTQGLLIYDDNARHFEPTPKRDVPRVEVVDELWSVLRTDQRPLHSAQWARANIEVCLAVLESARNGIEVALRYQVPPERAVALAGSIT